MKDSEMKNPRNDEDLEFYKFCDSALAFGILIPAGIAVGIVSAPASIPLASSIGATAGFSLSYAVSDYFSYQELYEMNRKDNNKLPLDEEANKEKYNITKNGNFKIPSPSFEISKLIKKLFEAKGVDSKSK